MRRRGTTNETIVRLVGLGDRLTHDSPARAAGFRSLHTHAHTRCTASQVAMYGHALHRNKPHSNDSLTHPRCLAVHRAVTAVTALAVSPSLLQFIGDPILAILSILTVPWASAGGALLGPSTPNRKAVLLLLLGPSRLSLRSLSSPRSPSLPPSKNLVQTALWVLPQTNELLDDSFYAVAAVEDLPRWINTTPILRCHMRLFDCRAASSHISAHLQTSRLPPCFFFEHLSKTVDLFACHSLLLYSASASRLSRWLLSSTPQGTFHITATQ